MTANTQMIKTHEQNLICSSNFLQLIIEANAGAAKTTSAAMKIAMLISKGMDPSKIVALSFSEPGVQAYRNAFQKIGIPAKIASSIRVGTFEEFCTARLRKLEGVDVKQTTRPEEVREFVLTAINEARTWASNKFGTELSIDGTGELAVEGLLDEFEQIKGSMVLRRQDEDFRISPDGAIAIDRSFTTLAILKVYERQRLVCVDDGGEHPRFRYSGDATYDLANIITADDPCFTYETHPLRLNLQAVILDEMHDTNWAMFNVLKELLAVNEGAFFLGVGDRDQVIHAQHGAESYFMEEGFDTHIGKPQRLKLTESFRFGRKVSNPLSEYSGKEYPVHQENISQVTVKKATETIDVLALINSTVAAYPNSPKSQIAVLLRHPSAAVELEHALRSRSIRYQAVDFTTYLERPEVLYARTLLGYAVGLEEFNVKPVAHLAKRATWAFMSSSSELDQLEKSRLSENVETAQFSRFAEFILPDALELNEVGLFSRAVDDSTRRRLHSVLDLAASDDIKCLQRVFDFLDIESSARRVFVRSGDSQDAGASIAGLVKASKDYSSISQFLRSLMMHDHVSHSDRFTGERIVLSSIPAAKGLEFDHVVIPDIDEANFDGNIRDERNLFYVAVSRARHTLTLTYRSSEPSSYLRHFNKDTTF